MKPVEINSFICLKFADSSTIIGGASSNFQTRIATEYTITIENKVEVLYFDKPENIGLMALLNATCFNLKDY